jgi:uncharacterized protein YcbX
MADVGGLNVGEQANRGTPVARVHQVWIFPVKSMRGMSVPTASVTAGGLADDRAWAVVDPTGEAVTAKQEPRLRQVTAHVVGEGVVALDVPSSPPGLTGPAADEALSSWLGRPLRLEHRGDAGFVDVAPVHLVSTFSITTSAHAEECDACDISEPRANLVLDLSPPDPEGPDDGERAWIGRSVLLGSATLDVVRRPKHCLGVYANVAAAGRIAVGDEVALAAKEGG